MSVTIPNFLTAKTVNGLNTYNYTVQQAAVHNASIRVDKLPDSQMTIAIQLNSSTQASITLSSTLPYGAQSSQFLSIPLNCAMSDVISFVLSSSTASDEQLQSCKAILNVHIGGLN